EQGRRLPRKDLEPVPHGRLAIVVALVELRAAPVAHARRPRGRRDEMVDGLAAAADTPTSQTSQQLPLGNLEVDHAVERLPRVLQEAGQRLCLRCRAGTPVEDEALLGV